MEEGTLTKWLVKVGDTVAAGDIMAEIETDKATMEFEAVDEGTIAEILVAEGTEGVKVGVVIATLAMEGEDASAPAALAPAAAAAPVDAAPASPSARKLAEELGVDLAKVTGTGPGGRIIKSDIESAAASGSAKAAPTAAPAVAAAAPVSAPAQAKAASGERVIASPLAKRIAEQKGLDLASISGSGPNGRIVKADVDGVASGAVAPVAAAPAAQAPAPAAPAAQPVSTIPHVVEKLSGMRKTIARRLSESKQQVPHIYLTVDIRLDALLKLRGELNAALESQGVKLSVNDLLIKALAKSLVAVPSCNVQFAGDTLIKFARADISVAVSIPGGLITPVVQDAGSMAVSAISTTMKDLATRARDGKLSPQEYQGGTASLSNMGMYGIKQFEAIINPPQAMIMAIGAGEKRPYVVGDALAISTVMSATGSFDHRAIDGADGAQLMKVFKELIEAPLGLVA